MNKFEVSACAIIRVLCSYFFIYMDLIFTRNKWRTENLCESRLDMFCVPNAKWIYSLIMKLVLHWIVRWMRLAERYICIPKPHASKGLKPQQRSPAVVRYATTRRHWQENVVDSCFIASELHFHGGRYACINMLVTYAQVWLVAKRLAMRIGLPI